MANQIDCRRTGYLQAALERRAPAKATRAFCLPMRRPEPAPQFLTSFVSWLTIAVIARLYVHAWQGSVAMERRVRFARSIVLARSEDLQKKFLELQKLKEQVRLAEIAAKQIVVPRANVCVSERWPTVNGGSRSFSPMAKPEDLRPEELS